MYQHEMIRTLGEICGQDVTLRNSGIYMDEQDYAEIVKQVRANDCNLPMTISLDNPSRKITIDYK
jgi:hypothetical protein